MYISSQAARAKVLATMAFLGLSLITAGGCASSSKASVKPGTAEVTETVNNDRGQKRNIRHTSVYIGPKQEVVDENQNLPDPTALRQRNTGPGTPGGNKATKKTAPVGGPPLAAPSVQ